MTSKKLLLLIFLTALVFVGLMAYGDFRDVGQRIAKFPVSYFLAALGLAALNYYLRYLRWGYYLRTLKIDVPWRTSALVFVSGLALSLTPGKVGELLKSYLLRNRSGVAISASAPIVLMERLTDAVAVVLVGLSGLLLLPTSLRWVMGAILALCAVGLLLLLSRYSQRLFGLPGIRRWKESLLVSQDSLRSMAAPRQLVVAVGLGTAAWLSEAVAFWIILQGVAAEVDFLRALPIYTSATIVGAISTLPGGLVGTEGTMVALLQQADVGRAAASTGTLLVRLATLWFGVALGLAALGWMQRSWSFPWPVKGEGARPGRGSREAPVLPQED